MDVAIAADGQRGWALGVGGAVLATRDGGATWHPLRYQKLPAPWFYATAATVLSFAGWLIARNMRVERQAAKRESITEKGVTDEPISRKEQDRLGFRPIVLGLTRYLRNVETKPPLTIAISAPWGRGKSSVMRMLLAELSEGGVRCVWFNPWHHQKEEILLAPLLESIRRQAIPPVASWLGLRFRVRLLVRRIRAHPYASAVLAAALVLPAAHFHVVEATAGLLARPLDWPLAMLDGLASLWGDGGVSEVFSRLAEAKPLEFVDAVLKKVAGRPARVADEQGQADRRRCEDGLSPALPA